MRYFLLVILTYLSGFLAAICVILVGGVTFTRGQRRRWPILRKLDGKQVHLSVITVILLAISYGAHAAKDIVNIEPRSELAQNAGELELVDVALIEQRMSETQEPVLHEMDEILGCTGPTCPDTMPFPHIDVKIRNTSVEPAVLKEARIQVHDRLELIPCAAPYVPLPPSFEYEIVLDPEKSPPYTESIGISQAVPPKEADRFQFSVAEGSPYGAGLYLVTLVLIYNEAGNELTSKQMLIAVPSMGRPWYAWSDYFCNGAPPAYLESIESFLNAPALRYTVIDEIQELAIEAQKTLRE